MVAASWFGVALSTAEGARAHVAQVYNWQCAVPFQCYLSREMVKDIYYKFIQFSLSIYDGQEFVDGSALIGHRLGAFLWFCQEDVSGHHHGGHIETAKKRGTNTETADELVHGEPRYTSTELDAKQSHRRYI